MIRIDKTQFSVVVLCTKCPGWRVLRNDKVAGETAGRQHNLTEHAGDTAALSAARQRAYRARKAAQGT